MAQDADEGERPDYIHIHQNDFSYRKHKKQKGEDIAICECKYDIDQVESACGDCCLNFLTNTECTPGFCPCGVHCKNQRFQKCEYAKTKLFKTESRGWGLLADQDIKAGHFVMEYCGEVISWKEAKRRSQAYELRGVRDAFMISLNASESIDATKKGSLARFINHSCQPNCETRKWHVLGEVRVGIFAKQDIPVGTELAYNYNFEWYGGAKVRCRCGAPTCSGFLGAKSRGFQEDTYLWEDDDERYSVEKIPLYDSAEDEPSKIFNTNSNSLSAEYDSDEKIMDVKVESDYPMLSTNLVVGSLDLVAVEVTGAGDTKDEAKLSQYTEQSFAQNNSIISRSRKYQVRPKSVPKKRLKKGRLRKLVEKEVDVKAATLLLASKEAREEVLKFEEMKNDAASQLESLYDEIRPTIEEYERDNQDSVATSVAEKWIEVSTTKLKADFDLYYSLITNISISKHENIK